MIQGVGVDIVNLKRFKNYLNTIECFKSRLFSTSELALTENQLAGNFAVKEAFYKASGIKFDFSQCSVLRDETGNPFIAFNTAIYDCNNLSFFISITNNDKYAIAIVLIQSNPTFVS
jgi:holo-[acyl-carrier protein] synthase